MSTIKESAAANALSLMNGLAAGDLDQLRALFAGPVDIDDPFGGHHVEGGLERMVESWVPAHLTRFVSAEVTHSTVTERFSGTEITIQLEGRQGQSVELPTVVVCELNGDGAIEKSRIYYRRARVDGRQHVRGRMLDEPISPIEFDDTMSAYQDALKRGDVEGMMATFGPEFTFDGHGEAQDLSEGLGMGVYTRDEIRATLGQMFGLIGENKGANLEKLNVFSDGTTTVLEFNIVEPEHPTNLVHAGVACYEKGEDGLLLSARVYDEAW